MTKSNQTLDCQGKENIASSNMERANHSQREERPDDMSSLRELLYLQASKKSRAVNYHCLTCHEEEKIPYDVVRDFDKMDGGDSSIPPQFSGEQCRGEMCPEYYKGVHGYEYKLSDVL